VSIPTLGDDRLHLIVDIPLPVNNRHRNPRRTRDPQASFPRSLRL
jgi:hypothetical protein